MTYEHTDDLHLTYSPARGYWHFVLYHEPPVGPHSAINAGQRFETSTSPYAAEWLARQDRCKPDALHVALVGTDDAPELWQPCVYDDPQSPSAMGDGCMCWQTFRDPLTLLPVAANHHLTPGRDTEDWTYWTYAPLSIPDGERLTSLIIDRETKIFWVRTDRGDLHLLPEKRAAGYEVGYRGGGPTELARMIEKIVRSDGYDISAGTPRPPHAPQMPDKKVLAWVSSTTANRTQELALDQLRTLCRTGMVA